MNNVEALPYGWHVEKLGNLLEKIVGGGTPARENEKFWNGAVPWATVKDLRKSILHNTEESITEEALKESASNLIPKNTLIIATRMALGKVALFTQDVAINQDLKALFPKKELARQFLFHWLLYRAEEIERLGSGSTVKGIRLEVLKGLEVLLPPLSEQQKIAEILSIVDEKIAVIDEQLAKTTELKTGLMQRLLTKGISRTTFKYSPLGEIPESWEVVQLGDVAEINPPKPQGLSRDFRVSFVGMTDLSEDAKLKSHHLRQYEQVAKGFTTFIDGDVLVAKITPCFENGKGAMVFGLTNGIGFGSTEFHVLRAKPRALNKYIYYHTTSNPFRQIGANNMTGSAGQKRVSKSFISTYNIPLPPIAEQRQITELLTTVDDKIQVLLDKKEHYQTLKRGLMQQLLTGKLRVRVTEDVVTA